MLGNGAWAPPSGMRLSITRVRVLYVRSSTSYVFRVRSMEEGVAIMLL